MSLQVDIQSAPVARGTVGTPSAWSTSGPTKTMFGVYVGDDSKTFTFTSRTTGTIGVTATISVDWDDGEGQTGRLNVGTDHGYASDDEVYVNEGVSVAFTSGTAFAAAATFTVAVTASRRVPGDPIVISGDANPTDVQITEYARGDRDIVEYSFDGRETRARRSTTGQVRLFTDYLNDAQRDKLLYLHASRTMVCVGENYDENTLFLFHGGGEQAFIGDRSSFTRNTVATFPDGRTGLLRSVGANKLRSVAGQAGRAVLLDAASTNVATYSSVNPPSTVWNVTGGATTLAWDDTIITPYDTGDSYWNADHIGGCARVSWGSGVVVGTDSIHSNDFTVTAVRNITASIYVRGFGEVAIHFRTGVASITTVVDTATVQLTSDWQRVELFGTSAVGHVLADVAIYGQEQGVCYLTGLQVEDDNTLVSSLIQTEGSPATRNDDDQTFTQPLPVPAGTFSFWFYWPGGTGANQNYGFINATGVTGTERFRIYYQDNGAGSTLWISMNTTLTALVQMGAPFTTGWNHFVYTWQEHPSTDGTMFREVYIDGVNYPFFIGSENTTAWEPFFGTGFTLGKAFAAGSPINGLRVEEIRIDKVAWTQAQVTAQYERLTDEDWLHVHRAHAGRKYRITSMRESWLHTAQPDKVVMELILEEADREDDGVVIEA